VIPFFGEFFYFVFRNVSKISMLFCIFKRITQKIPQMPSAM